MKRLLSVFLALAFLFSFGLAVPAAANNASNALSGWTCPNAPQPDDWTCPNTPAPPDCDECDDDGCASCWVCPNEPPPWECGNFRPGPCPDDPTADECECPVFDPYECPDCEAFWCTWRNRWIVTYICADCRDAFPDAFICWECFDAGCAECRNCTYCMDAGCDECRDMRWYEWLRISTQQMLYYMFFGWLLGFGSPNDGGFGAWLGSTWVGTLWNNFRGLFRRSSDDNADDDCDDCIEAYECEDFAGCGGYLGGCTVCTATVPCPDVDGCGGVAGGCTDCVDEFICAACDD